MGVRLHSLLYSSHRSFGTCPDEDCMVSYPVETWLCKGFLYTLSSAILARHAWAVGVGVCVPRVRPGDPGRMLSFCTDCSDATSRRQAISVAAEGPALLCEFAPTSIPAVELKLTAGSGQSETS